MVTSTRKHLDKRDDSKDTFVTNDNSKEVVIQASAMEKDCESVNTSPFEIKSEKYSSFTKLLRVTALALRFIRKIRKAPCESGRVTSSELKEAEQMWLLHAQRKQFAPELNSPATGQRNSLQQQLDLFLDERRLLRCQGRLGNAGISKSTKHPVLLPRKEHLTNIIIEKMHIEVLHSGVFFQTLAKTRQKYWIPRGRATVKRLIQKYNVCRRFYGGPYQMPPMPSLPSSRVTESRPFLRVGLDYMGPVIVKSNGDHKKVWICLFTCLVTRGVHLEIVLDLSTVEFLLCLRRLVSQKGTPIQIISDNAAQFKFSSSILDKIWCKTLHSEDVQSYVSNSGITWNFITEVAPWMGGFYERLVGLVKKVFRKALGRRFLTLIQLQTLVKEAEAVVNSRPLVYVGDGVISNVTLTPSHFFTLNPSTLGDFSNATLLQLKYLSYE